MPAGDVEAAGPRAMRAGLFPNVKELDSVLDLDTVVAALEDFGACVRLDVEFIPVEKIDATWIKWRRAETIMEMCDAKTLDQLATRSKVHKYLVDTFRAVREKPRVLLSPCASCRMVPYQPW